jgi:transcriptional regulator with XRE-family HTH domain
MNYIEIDTTGSAGTDLQQQASQWSFRCDESTAGIADLWRWLFTRSGTGSNVLGSAELGDYSARTSADNVRRVLEIMKPSVKDLASLFEVSRQTIYNWMNGDEPKAEQAERLSALATVADIVAAENISDRSRLLKRAGAGGSSLWDVVKEGGDVVEFARQLVHLAQVERGKMRKLNERFAHRRRGDDGGELTPRLDETP